MHITLNIDFKIYFVSDDNKHLHTIKSIFANHSTFEILAKNNNSEMQFPEHSLIVFDISQMTETAHIFGFLAKQKSLKKCAIIFASNFEIDDDKLAALSKICDTAYFHWLTVSNKNSTELNQEIILLLKYWQNHIQIQKLQQEKQNILDEKNRINNKFLEFEDKLNVIVNSVPDLIFYKDINSIYQGSNKAFANFANTTVTDIQGTTDFDLFPKEIAADYITDDKKIFETGNISHGEEWITYPNGEKILLDTIKTPFYNAKNEISGLVGISRDITQLRIKQEKLEESEKKYRLLAETMVDIIWTYDLKQKFITYISPSASKILGYSEAEILNQPFTILLTPLSGTKINYLFSLYETNQSNIFNRIEIEYFTKTNFTFWTETITNAIRNADGEVTHILGVSRDISKRKAAEIALKEKEQQLSEVLKLSEIASLEYDLYTKEIKLSDNFFEVMGIIDYELQQKFSLKGLIRYVYYSDKITFLKLLIKVFDKNENIEHSYRIIDSNEVIRYIRSLTQFRFDDKMRPTTFIATFQNITFQKINEELLKNVELAERAANIRQQFLANISHEIRTPLTAIIGFTNFLFRTPLNQQQLEYSKSIKEASEILLHIINDILIISKIDAGKLQIKNDAFSIFSMIKEIESLFENQIKAKNLYFKTYIAPNFPEFIIADESRLKQVISNLISNAVKFTDSGGIELICFVNEIENDKVSCSIMVEDTGIGISKQDLEKLFVKFSQVDASLTRNKEGIGLGLAISKELIELMGGTINVESQEGKGTRFTINLTAQIDFSTKHNAIGKYFDYENLNLGLTILYVEDKLVNQKVVSLMLEYAGCKVVMANNGEEAISIFEPGKYNLILMDIQMPIMDGITTMKELKKKYKQLPPIIAVSANALEGDAEKYISEGLDDYISKPISEEVLYQKITHWSGINKEFIKIENKKNNNMETNYNFESFALINEQTIETIKKQAKGDMGFIQMLFESYLTDANELIEQIQNTLNNNNFQELKVAVHTFKGLSGTIGASQVHEIAKEIDKNLKTDHNEEAVKLLPMLQDKIVILTDYIKKMYF